MEREHILTIIKKLQALSTSDNEHEAALAMQRMQELLQKYNVSLEDVDELDLEKNEGVDHVEYNIREEKSGNYKWKVKLLWSIMQYNFCTGLLNDVRLPPPPGKKRPVHRTEMIIIGKPHNREVVMFLFKTVAARLDELSKKYSLNDEDVKEPEDFHYSGKPDQSNRWSSTLEDAMFHHLWDIHGLTKKQIARLKGEDEYGYKKVDAASRERLEEIHGRVHNPRTFGPRKSFLYGAVTEIDKRLHEQWAEFNKKAKETPNSKALMVINREYKEIAEYKENHFVTSRGKAYSMNVNAKAFGEGRAAGRVVPFQTGVGGGSNVGTKSLGSGR
jgi:hypothetical protein